MKFPAALLPPCSVLFCLFRQIPLCTSGARLDTWVTRLLVCLQPPFAPCGAETPQPYASDQRELADPLAVLPIKHANFEFWLRQHGICDLFNYVLAACNAFNIQALFPQPPILGILSNSALPDPILPLPSLPSRKPFPSSVGWKRFSWAGILPQAQLPTLPIMPSPVFDGRGMHYPHYWPLLPPSPPPHTVHFLLTTGG